VESIEGGGMCNERGKREECAGRGEEGEEVR